MTTLQLYTQPIPDADQTRGRSSQQPNNSLLGLLNSDPSAAKRISTPPGEQQLTAQHRGRYADLMADEIEELGGASGFTELPLFARSERTAIDGYYLVDDARVSPVDPREPRVQEIQITLSRAGTRTSHWRAVATNPQDVDNPFGSGATEEIAVSVRTSDHQWYNPDTGATESATVQREIDGEHDQLSVFDVTESSFSEPVLLYNISYQQEWPTDCRVWDDYGRDKVDVEVDSGATVGSATVGSATIPASTTVDSTWQRVFITDHDWVGQPVLETDRLRLVADTDQRRLLAYLWTGDHYAIRQLGVSPWRLCELDLTHVGPTAIEAQTEWEDVNTGDRHTLDLTLGRGDDAVLWTVPQNGSSPPSGLVDRLDPIAQTTDRGTAERPAIIQRSKVRR